MPMGRGPEADEQEAEAGDCYQEERTKLETHIGECTVLEMRMHRESTVRFCTFLWVVLEL